MSSAATRIRTRYLLICLLGSTGCSGSMLQPDTDEWYNIKLGAAPPIGAVGRPGIVEGMRLRPPSPWQEVVATTDANNKALSVSFVEVCCEAVFDAPESYVPKRYRSEGDMIADARAAQKYVMARLGPPSMCVEQRSDKQREQVLEWRGNRGTIGKASIVRLELGYSVIRLEVIGKDDPKTRGAVIIGQPISATPPPPPPSPPMDSRSLPSCQQW